MAMKSPFYAQSHQLIADFLSTQTKFALECDNTGLKIPKPKPPIIVLLGPTASGKTALSIELCKAFNGEVISADSRQVYREMDIGTDKIAVTEQRLTEGGAPRFDDETGLFHDGIRHHLIDVINPDERFTVADFKKSCERLVPEITARGKVAFIVGGTGLYIRATTENFLIPDEDPTIKERLYSELKTLGAEALHKRLSQVDPEAAAKIHFNNHPYVVRALEIFELTGKPKSEHKSECPFAVLKIGLSWPREVMFERINKRAQEQLTKNGLIAETQKLLDHGYGEELSSMSSLGYREVIAHLKGQLTLPQTIELLQQNTRNYGKRQLTWFKKEPNVTWIQAQVA